MSRADQLLEFIGSELVPDGEPLLPEDELLTTGRMDSLGLMRLVGFIKATFGVAVPYKDILVTNFRSVRDIDAYLASHDEDGA